MTSTYSTNLKLNLMGTGDQSGTWGSTTNTNLGTLIEEAIVGYVTQAVADSATPTSLTIPNGASSNGRNYVIELTGVLTANRTVEVPAVDKPYIFYNNPTGGYTVTVKVSGQTGVTIKAGKKAIVYTNSTDVIEVANAPVTEDGAQTLTGKTMSGSSNTFSNIPFSALAGSVTVAAGGTGQTSYTDGQLLIGNSTGNTLDKATLTAGTNATITNGSGSITVGVSTAPTFSSGIVTMSGSSSALAAKIKSIAEPTTISATAATGTINFDVLTQSVLYYTTNASANFTVNFRGDGSNTLNSLLSTGDAITVVFMCKTGSTAYYNSAVQVDGSSVTPKWQGGSAPTFGNTSSVDIYSYTIIKTASATFTVLASQVQFA